MPLANCPQEGDAGILLLKRYQEMLVKGSIPILPCDGISFSSIAHTDCLCSNIFSVLFRSFAPTRKLHNDVGRYPLPFAFELDYLRKNHSLIKPQLCDLLFCQGELRGSL